MIIEVLTNIEVQVCVCGGGWMQLFWLTRCLKLRTDPQCTAARMDARTHVRQSDRKPKMSVTFFELIANVIKFSLRASDYER